MKTERQVTWHCASYLLSLSTRKSAIVHGEISPISHSGILAVIPMSTTVELTTLRAAAGIPCGYNGHSELGVSTQSEMYIRQLPCNVSCDVVQSALSRDVQKVATCSGFC